MARATPHHPYSPAFNMENKAITASTITFAATIGGAVLWAQSYFMVRADADTVHKAYEAAAVVAAEAASKALTKVYYELTLSTTKANLSMIEDGGVTDAESRDYELLKKVEANITLELMEL